eukprot:gene1-1_t
MEESGKARYLIVLLIPIFLFLFLLSGRGGNSPAFPNSGPEQQRVARHLHESESANPQGPTKEKNLSGALEKLRKVLSLIRNRYELDKRQGSQFFRTANNISPLTWDMIKYSLAYKMVQPKASYLMVFGGSSVTAGHDNYFNQSYPMIFQHRMKEVFDALGIDLIVHNIAMGANNCLPYTYCYEAMGGRDPDFLGWEQSYNCGRDGAVFEFMARLALFSRNLAVVYYSASGAWSPSNCPPSTDAVPYCAETWSPAIANLTEWHPQVNDIETEKDSLFRFNAHGASAARFINGFKNDYTNSGLLGFNVWEKNGQCEIPKGDGVVNCNGLDAVEGCTMKFMTHEASVFGQPSGRGAGWHPPRAFHMLRGEAIAWLYSLILFESIFMVEQDLLGQDYATLSKTYEKKLLEWKSAAFPHPKQCSGYHCERHPICFTGDKPQLYSSAKSASAKPLIRKTFQAGHYQQHYNMSLQSVVLGSSSWTYEEGAYGSWSLEFGYLDSRSFYYAKSPDEGELFVLIDLSASKSDFVLYCGVNKDDQVRFAIEFNATQKVLRNYSPPPIANATLNAQNKAVYNCGKDRCRFIWENVRRLPGSDCAELMGLPIGGMHALGVLPVEGNKHAVGFNHLILFP